jgi:hypothetical protein
MERSAFRPEAMWVLRRPGYCGGIDPFVTQQSSALSLSFLILPPPVSVPERRERA